MERVDKIISDNEFIMRTRLTEEYEKTRKFCGHGRDHLLATARIAWILCLENNLQIEKDIVYAAGLLHDVGRSEQYDKGVSHEVAGTLIAKDILERCGYHEDEISLIIKAIGLHRTREIMNDKNLNGVLYKADKLSRECFLCKASDDCNWSDEKKNSTIDF